VLEVPREEVSSYGVIDPGAQDGALTEVLGLVEKPPVERAPSNKIISGRYILQPEVMRTLENQGKGAGGEIQLTDAMAKMIGNQPFHAVTFAGRRFDCGSKTGFVEATLALALEREDMGGRGAGDRAAVAGSLAHMKRAAGSTCRPYPSNFDKPIPRRRPGLRTRPPAPSGR
jgi:UTP-glucose-1-phosphate uridylyltransferase